MYAFGVRAVGSGGRVLRGNPRLVGAVVGGFALQALIVSWPAAHDLFGTTRFDVRTWVLVGGLSAGAALILAVLGVREHASTETTVGHDSVPVTDGAVDRRP